MKKLIYTALCAVTVSSCFAQSKIFTASDPTTLEFDYNSGRVRANVNLDGWRTGHWGNRGNSGVTEIGEVWHGFSRYKMFNRDLFNQVNTAGSITWTTGLYQKELGAVIGEVDSSGNPTGNDVDVYLVLDPDGTFLAPGTWPGEEVGFTNAFDWANEIGLGYPDTVKIGTILKSEPMATDEEKDTISREIPVDSPAMRIHFDVTDQIKQWISDGILTVDSTIAFGLVQRAWEISDGNGNVNPLRFADPNYGLKSMMVFDVKNSFLTVSAEVSDPKGPGPFSEYDLIDGYVNTDDWMGWVYVDQYPWCWLVSLDKYVFVSDSGNWVYIPM